MIKKICTKERNISNSVEFLLLGAQKRRANAQLCAKSLESDMGMGRKLVAVR